MLKFYSIKVIYILLALIYRQKTGATGTNENENKSALYYVRVVACKYFTQQGSKLFQEVIGVFFVLIHENKNNFQII